MFAEKMTIGPLPPFRFDLSTEIFADGDKQIRKYENGRFWQLIRINDKLILANVESEGTVDEPKLSVVLRSNSKIMEHDKEKAAEIIKSLFNLDLDLKPFYETAKHDETLLKITQKLRGLRSPTTQTVYEALVDSIVEQQISLKVANALERKIIRKYGGTLTVDGEVYYEYPTPQQIAAAPLEELRGCGLSQRKAEYIKEISVLIAEGKLDLEKYKKYDNAEEIIEELDALRGIGAWTAELTIIRSMQKWDALPADDLGLRRIIAHYYRNEKKIDSAEARRIAEPWGKWRGLAAYYLVVAEMLEVAA